ncbi:ABC transporter permease [Olivibacter sp. SDN3]|uniref:ABC transporter permease n=1 Tax=Olivibacter sp. SDN3 TaxID=2764720 RepID=UPI001650E3A1|nr:ABC transporter permease [Olivibacter sp. SDN3]QNL48155.1 ABC transporter permease [Olivibacter sp. SDN3]
MIKNHIRIAWRNLLKNKSYTAINIIGLAVSIAAVLLIALWVQNQFLYDNFYSNGEHIYKVRNRGHNEGKVFVHDITSAPVAKTLKQQYPEVTHAGRIYWASDRLFSYGAKNLKAKGNDVDADFLQVFDFPFIHGSAKGALDDPNSIVLMESLAKSLFGKEDPLGKTITMDSSEPYKVTGVLKELPTYTDFDFDFLIQLSPGREKNYGTSWQTNTYYTFVKLREGSDIAAFNKKVEPFVRTNASDKEQGSIFLYPMAKMHLYDRFENGIPVGGQIEQVRLVLGIGLLILLIACINFMNLATARSQKRSKEVGVRKVVGATKRSLVQQFLSESILLAFISGIIAIGVTVLCLPLFNSLLDKPLVMDWGNPVIWGLGSVFILSTGLLAGIYPAFVLSAFKPIKTLKGMTGRPRQVNLRQALVVLQFGIAVVLIAATLVIRLQIDFAGKRAVGYDVSQLIEIPAEGDMGSNYDVFKAELLRNGMATQVTRTGWPITTDASSASGMFSWEGATPEQVKNSFFVIVRTESDFVNTLGLTLADGRDLDYARLPADSASVLLNETAIKTMGLENPVGKYLKWGEDTYTIVGVVKDFITESPYRDFKPMLIRASKNFMMNVVIRSNPQFSMTENLQGIEKIIKKFNPAYPFTYNFVDQRYAEKFREQEQMARLAFVFSLLAIFISCLGLFGLASYIAETRIKEIGIRKVLGASVTGISTMLSKDFIKLVMIAILLATPIAWWTMNNWLNDFSYRIEIEWWMLVLSGGIAITIALLTVSTQAVRAARSNPVNSIRDV